MVSLKTDTENNIPLDMNQVKKILINRLENKGVELSLIPGFIRSLANSFMFNPQMNLSQVNKRLNYMGWENFEIDYHTLQLAISFFETEGIEKLEYKSPLWFENSFKPVHNTSIESVLV
ncbi:MAG: hypothetical protein HN737_09840 [Desulfobacterales bacterium]|nr:hypothetical protein [Desulfobacteraceae bacterium]MBT7084925.1 hypothetical protein [Desulfobacterales bacterium]MBT7697694.1 hypothetical protein [Desulfobacterales bacterium]